MPQAIPVLCANARELSEITGMRENANFFNDLGFNPPASTPNRAGPQRFYLIMDGQRLAALASAQPFGFNLLALQRIGVRAPYRGQGLARTLADHIFKEADREHLAITQPEFPVEAQFMAHSMARLHLNHPSLMMRWLTVGMFEGSVDGSKPYKLWIEDKYCKPQAPDFIPAGWRY